MTNATSSAVKPQAMPDGPVTDETGFCEVNTGTSKFPHMFSTRAGIPAQDALEQASTILYCVKHQLSCLMDGEDDPHTTSQLMLTEMAVEQAKAAIDATIGGILWAGRAA